MLQTYHFDKEELIPSPALIYYKDTIIANTKRAIQIAGSAKRLWPHVKSHKSRDFIKLSIQLGITKFKCATISEAEMTAQAGAEHILLAYPLVGPNISRFIKLIQHYPQCHFYALGDNSEQLKHLSDIALDKHLCIDFLIDINTGMNRTGVTFESCIHLYSTTKQFKGINFYGLHCYDGDRHEKNILERNSKTAETLSTAQKIQSEIKRQSNISPILIMGGSPTFPCYAQNNDNTIFFSPGTVFIYDSGYAAQFPDLPYAAGAAILTRVISHPSEGYFTLDTGYKSISAEQGNRGILVNFPNASEAFQSEEHWVFRMNPGFESERPAIGSILYVIPWHICPTTALYSQIYLVSNQTLETIWDVSARDRSIGI